MTWILKFKSFCYTFSHSSYMCIYIQSDISRIQSPIHHPGHSRRDESPPHRSHIDDVSRQLAEDQSIFLDSHACWMACGQWGTSGSWHQPDRAPRRSHPTKCRICLQAEIDSLVIATDLYIPVCYSPTTLYFMTQGLHSLAITSQCSL